MSDITVTLASVRARADAGEFSGRPKPRDLTTGPEAYWPNWNPNDMPPGDHWVERFDHPKE